MTIRTTSTLAVASTLALVAALSGALADSDGPVITVTSPTLPLYTTGQVVNVQATIVADPSLMWARAQVNEGPFLWDSIPPHQWSFNLTDAGEGEHTLHVQARDNAGRYSSVFGAVVVDRTPPSVTVTDPKAGLTYVHGLALGNPFAYAVAIGTLEVKATATDAGSGVALVEFLVDDEVRATATETPFTWSWDTSGEMGFHTVTARATDRAGNVASSNEVDVLVVG